MHLLTPTEDPNQNVSMVAWRSDFYRRGLDRPLELFMAFIQEDAPGLMTREGPVRLFVYPPDANTPRLTSDVGVSLVRHGVGLAVPGDINQDGIADVVIGTRPSKSTDEAGKVTAISGKDLSVLWKTNPPRANDPQKSFGFGLAAGRDLDKDEVDEVLVYSDDYSSPVFVYSGKNGLPMFELINPFPGDDADFGITLSFIDDIDGDTISDIAIGHPDANAGEVVDAGAVCLFSGQGGSLIARIVPTTPQSGARVGEMFAIITQVSNSTGRICGLMGSRNHLYLYRSGPGEKQ
jgi:hypothetical protein